MDTTRRGLLKTGAAASLIAALPAGAVAAVVEAVTNPWSFAYTADGAIFMSGYATRDAAISAGLEAYGGEAIQTAHVSRYDLTIPSDLAEAAADGLVNTNRLGNLMTDWLTSANEEADFDDGFSDACNRLDRTALGDAGRRAIAAALDRAGDPTNAACVRDPAIRKHDIPESVLDRLAVDRELDQTLQDILRAWSVEHRLADDLNGLIVQDLEAHGTARAIAA